MSLVIYWSCYQSHRSDIYRSDWSLRQFILLMNCMLGSMAFLSKLIIVLTDLTFIGLICFWGNSLHLKIICLVLPFIWASMQLWLLDYLTTSLDLSTISGLLQYKDESSFDKRSIEKLWCWRPKNRFNCIQSAIFLFLHSQLLWWQELDFALNHQMHKSVSK